MVFDKFLLGRRRDQLSEGDIQALEHEAGPVRKLPPRSMLVREGDPVSVSTYLIEGFMCRYKDDREGQRQIVAVHVPGDFVDLHAYPLKRLDHDVATLTTCRVAQIPHARLDDIMAQRPSMAKLLWFSTLLDAAMHREWIFRLGRLNALCRLGHFFCELESKLRVVGLSDGCKFELPMTQTDLAEACGITAVHVNRMARELRERGMLRTQGNQVEILDREALYRLSEFDPAYLFISSTGAEH
ncbi:MAG: Crp/Fnr family transcriptional regulator [Sphingobium sp.]|uniref:Crp/Fnr family transcriptional regulator n=1 Tax=Sphingobium sp. TaxID=1912891 RepID=UPI0029B7C1B9|nr:Crp/Fnr family transcriptional regulator [Sphingobium sp.]MDX3908410.1 Crp/Fnr family transcriptional regulator [Sphingobium sp.]